MFDKECATFSNNNGYGTLKDNRYVRTEVFSCVSFNFCIKSADPDGNSKHITMATAHYLELRSCVFHRRWETYNVSLYTSEYVPHISQIEFP
jgi:hypothetical protein